MCMRRTRIAGSGHGQCVQIAVRSTRLSSQDTVKDSATPVHLPNAPASGITGARATLVGRMMQPAPQPRPSLRSLPLLAEVANLLRPPATRVTTHNDDCECRGGRCRAGTEGAAIALFRLLPSWPIGGYG